ncbi:MAG: hypothetical protein ACE5GQ_01910 [Nitrospinales bacterium]
MDKIGDFKNLHRGKRLFILASGPSLSTLDLSPLKRRMVMGLNRSFLAYPDGRYHCVMDHRLFELFPSQLRQTRCLFTLENRPWGIPIKLLGAEKFSLDLEQGIYSGYTVSYLALQVAHYMGFKEIFFLGLDLKLDRGRTHFFGYDFRSSSHEKTEFPRMRKMLAHGAHILKKQGVCVYNCSLDADLDCFPKVSFDYAMSL